MADVGVTRVAVYIDFDNIVISRYDQVHGRNQFQRDRARLADRAGADPELADRLERATVDVGAIIDFASSFGTLVLTRAYADWSAPVNADYRGQLVARAVDLVQLFPAAAYAKNGADIRLAVDAVEDMFRLPDLTHVVIVAGDSDYIALAQRCKRLGRYVVGIGVAGSTSRTLAAACDELVTYDALPGIAPVDDPQPVDVDGDRGTTRPRRGGRGRRRAGDGAADGSPDGTDGTANGVTGGLPAASDAAGAGDTDDARTGPERDDPDDLPVEDTQEEATRLLARALRLGHEKDDADWLHSSAVKSQMKRMDPSFSEKALGFRSFSDFVRSRDDLVEMDESTTARLLRLRG